MKIHLAKQKEAVQCPLCDKKYQDERYMLRHLRTSHTRSQLPCPLCDKRLASAAGLRHHVLTHSALNTFRCKCCPKTYAVKRSVVKHLRKRHGLKSSEINTKDYFKRIDPRDCNLGLDEEAMTKIFGPVKKSMNDILISDFVTLTKKFAAKLQNEDNEDDGNEDEDDDNDEDNNESEGNDDEDENEDNQHSDKGNEPTERHEIREVIIKTENKDGDDLEPTDFVSVKIEPMEDEDEVSES